MIWIATPVYLRRGDERGLERMDSLVVVEVQSIANMPSRSSRLGNVPPRTIVEAHAQNRIGRGIAGRTRRLESRKSKVETR